MRVLAGDDNEEIGRLQVIPRDGVVGTHADSMGVLQQRKTEIGRHVE